MATSRPGLARAGSSIAAQNKTIVLVTGGNKGIGYEIVKSLASQENYQILLGCRNTQDGEMAASSMGAPSNVNPIQLDITDDESIDRCYKAIDQHFGRIDVLINNAGTAGLDLTRSGSKPSPEEISPRELSSHIFNVNVISTGVVTDKLIPLLEQSKAPKIIFITSTLGSIGTVFDYGKIPAPGYAYYSASKTAVNMLAVQYAFDHPRFKVNTCCPGHRGTGLNDIDPTGEKDPALGAVNAVRLATETDGETATYTRTEGKIPW